MSPAHTQGTVSVSRAQVGETSCKIESNDEPHEWEEEDCGSCYCTWDIVLPIVTWIQWIWQKFFSYASSESSQSHLCSDPRQDYSEDFKEWFGPRVVPEDMWHGIKFLFMRLMSLTSSISNMFLWVAWVFSENVDAHDLWMWHPCAAPRKEQA